MLLQSKQNAKENPANRDQFITSVCYQSAELLYSGTISYLLALYRHFPHKLSSWTCPVNTGTQPVERLISQLHGQINHLQSLYKMPTYVDMLNRINIIEQNEIVIESVK